ncbi:glycosyltransferase family 87 protein [Paraliomyxa miuraensis]|uniref:glycosyltransferase family 87 protein n=1 Tax=Paraliomyxa miuraensis TaxID=376150 RepID=UPI00225BA4CB|nr:glycosyltransferase family 87 protein [Paraliomyxa miuraensis]MCX4243736.1 DUF2029 domain-containing protein [Paraliomyxa miuraensis]
MNEAGSATDGSTDRRLAQLRRLVEVLAIGWAVLLAVVFAWRVGFPLELEWMEGGLLHQAHRIAHGQSPYPAPGPEFVPFLYTPLYSVVLAVLGTVLPLGYVLGRVISILAWLATGLAVWRAVRGEGKPRAHAAAAVGLCCAGYVFTFRWLDLARPDTLFIALTLWALVLLREGRDRPRRVLWAGVLMALAFWTKQTAASFVLASGVAALWIAPRQLWIYVVAIGVIDGGGMLLGNALTDGWLWTYVYELHQSHAFNRERFTTKTWGMFVHAWPAVMLVVLGLLAHGLVRTNQRLRAWRSRRAGATTASPDDGTIASASSSSTPTPGWRGLAYWTLMALAGLLVSALGYATQWAEPNAFIPGVVLGAVALAVALPAGGRGERAALGLVSLQLVLSLLVEPLYQPVQQHGLAGLRHSYAWQDPWRTVPRLTQWQQARALRDRIEAAPGEILALHRPWWSLLAGGEGHVGNMGITDVRPDERAEIERALRQAVGERRYAWVWLEGEPPRWLARELSRGYRVQERLHGEARVRPLSGYMSEAGMVTPYERDQLLLALPTLREPPPGTTVIADFESGTLDGWQVLDGRAFTRPQRGTPRKLPLAGPYGGEMLLTSAGPSGRLELQGRVCSPIIELPASGHLELLAGFAGRRSRGLTVELVEEAGGRTVTLAIPPTPHSLHSLRWESPPEWAGARARLCLGDHSSEAALYVDDLWLVP